MPTEKELREIIAGLMEKGPRHVAEVVRHTGAGIQIPDQMPLGAAIDILQRKQRDEEEMTTYHATINASPFDGAWAMAQAMEELFGFSIQTSGPFAPRHKIEIEIDSTGTTVSVPWGTFEVPGIEGKLETSFDVLRGQYVFKIEARIKGKYHGVFLRLAELTRKIASERSIYRGKAMSVKFTDDDGDPIRLPEVKFVDTAKAFRPIFNDGLDEKLDNDVLAYLRHSNAIKKMRGSLKRGVLLAGPYGTGKTLTASYVAKIATDNGFTFLYVKAADVTRAIDYAALYEPAVIFAEDIDAVAGLNRTQEVEQLQNKLDGIDTKGKDIIVIFTTNHADKINPAMIRPGRIDVVLAVNPPDERAAIKLARYYAGGQLEESDFSEAGKMLAGMIPAVIQEAVSRAQIRALVRTGGQDTIISNDDLVGAAASVTQERDVFQQKVDERNQMLLFAHQIGQGIGAALNGEEGDLASAFGINGHVEAGIRR